MSESKWAAIVYGRSYYLDFRLIAIPKDFNDSKINWALEHIVATTRTADKLVTYPRWSLFKDKSHCIIGVTCMVRDLLGKLTNHKGQDLTQDNCGRPLYIFVGYSTQLKRHQKLANYLPYAGSNLGIFQPLYQYVQQQWKVKKYDKYCTQPIVTDYQYLTIQSEKQYQKIDNNLSLNHQQQAPNKVFLWQDLEILKQKLWFKAASCQQPSSLCLGAAKQQDLIKSPFFNGTVAGVTEFTIHERIKVNNQSQNQQQQRFSQVISQKIKEDLETTFLYAEQAVNFSQDLIENLGKTTNKKLQNQLNHNNLSQSEDFGFKPKHSHSDSQDWF